MVKFKIKKGWFKHQTVDVPTSWDDISYNQFKSIIETENSEDIFKELTGLDYVYAAQIEPYLNFTLKDLDPTAIEPRNYIEIQGEIYQAPNIYERSYGEKIIFNLKKDVAEMCAIYLMPKFEGNKLKEFTELVRTAKLTDLHAVCNNLKTQMRELLRREESLLSGVVDVKQKMAGIDKFGELGEFNTVDKIAREYNYTHEQVEQLNYNLVFLILRKQIISANFEKSYRSVLKSFKNE